MQRTFTRWVKEMRGKKERKKQAKVKGKENTYKGRDWAYAELPW